MQEMISLMIVYELFLEIAPWYWGFGPRRQIHVEI